MAPALECHSVKRAHHAAELHDACVVRVLQFQRGCVRKTGTTGTALVPLAQAQCGINQSTQFECAATVAPTPHQWRHTPHCHGMVPSASLRRVWLGLWLSGAPPSEVSRGSHGMVCLVLEPRLCYRVREVSQRHAGLPWHIATREQRGVATPCSGSPSKADSGAVESGGDATVAEAGSHGGGEVGASDDVTLTPVRRAGHLTAGAPRPWM